jgi:hypothetical protein
MIAALGGFRVVCRRWYLLQTLAETPAAALCSAVCANYSMAPVVWDSAAGILEESSNFLLE